MAFISVLSVSSKRLFVQTNIPNSKRSVNRNSVYQNLRLVTMSSPFHTFHKLYTFIISVLILSSISFFVFEMAAYGEVFSSSIYMNLISVIEKSRYSHTE